MIKCFVSGLWALLFTFALLPRAFAYPDLARHGYVNCTACHVSPSGGGVLTPYGRELSKDLLSTWSFEHESDLAYGLVKTPDWLNVGGDLRAIEIYRNTPQVEASRFLLMQGDVEAAATYGKFTADVRFGEYMDLNSLQSRQFYLNYRPTDELSFRAGKFQTAFGLMDPDHTTPVRRGLGWDEGTESYNIEAAWLGENLNAYLTGDFGPIDSKVIPTSAMEKGVAARVSVPFKKSYQVGGSYFHGKSDQASRDVVGPFGILGFAKNFYLLTETDLQAIKNNSGPNQTGLVSWNKLDYEFIQGLHGYLSYEFNQTDLTTAFSRSTAWGIGSEFFPRPHLEFDLLWRLQSTPAFPGRLIDQVTLLTHFYL